MASVKTRAGSISIGDNSTLLLIGGGLALAYFGIIKPVLDAGGTIAEALNLKDTKKEKEQQKEVEKNATSKGWNPQYYKSLQAARKSILIMTRQTAIRMSRDIFESAGRWNDDEEKIYGVLRFVKSQAHLSFLSEVFYSQYKQGLYDFLMNVLDWDIEKATVAQIINPLPDYILAPKK